MRTSLLRAGGPRAAALVITMFLLTATAFAGSGVPAFGPVYDITHFDVLPLSPPTVPYVSEKIAYKALFAFRAASRSDPGYEKLRIVNWQVATNHSFVVDVWNTYQAFEQHLAAPGSVKFRFSVQDLPGKDFGCCIGSPIDDRQYSPVESLPIPWTSDKLPRTVGPNEALWVIIYVDFLQELLQDYTGNPGQRQLVKYGAASLGMNKKNLFNYTILQQLARPNRFVILEVWDTAANYESWASGAVTTDFVSKITPLLGSPLDIRLNNLCGAKYVVDTGCTSP
jgi:quinol monooxygenase YgiN